MALAQIVLTIIYILILVITSILAFKTKYRLLFLPAILAVANESFRHTLPAVNIFIPEEHGGLSDSQISIMAIGSALDLSYIISWLAGFCIMAKLSKPRIERLRNTILTNNIYNMYTPNSSLIPFTHINSDYYLNRIKPILLFAFICTVAIYPLSTVMNWPTAYGQWDLFSFGLWSQAKLPYLGKFLIRVVISAPCIASCYLLLRRNVFFSKKNWLPIATIVSYILWGLARGGRGIAILPLVLLILCAFVSRQRLYKYFFVFFISLLLLLLLSPQIRASRHSTEFREEGSLFGRIKLLFTLETAGYTTWDWNQIDRFNNALFTGQVYEHTKSYGHAGIDIYKGLPFIAIPQFVWHQKTPLGSVDGTATGRLYTLLYFWNTGNYGVTLTPGPGAQPYWFAGWPAVFTLGFMGGVVVAFMWGYLRIAYNPFGLIIFFGVIIKGTELSFIYYDWTFMLEEFVQRGLLILFLYIITIPFTVFFQKTKYFGENSISQITKLKVKEQL